MGFDSLISLQIVLLIVPRGIEIEQTVYGSEYVFLLIVPRGIEIPLLG